MTYDTYSDLKFFFFIYIKPLFKIWRNNKKIFWLSCKNCSRNFYQLYTIDLNYVYLSEANLNIVHDIYNK